MLISSSSSLLFRYNSRMSTKHITAVMLCCCLWWLAGQCRLTTRPLPTAIWRKEKIHSSEPSSLPQTGQCCAQWVQARRQHQRQHTARSWPTAPSIQPQLATVQCIRCGVDNKQSQPAQSRRAKRNTITSYPWDLSIYDGDTLSAAPGGYGSNYGRYNNYNNNNNNNGGGGGGNGGGGGGNNGGGNGGGGGGGNGNNGGGGANNGGGGGGGSGANNGGNNGGANTNGGQQLGFGMPFSGFNQFGQANPFQTNRLDANGNPILSFASGLAGNAPVFLVSKNMGFSSWFLPFLLMLALPFIVGAAFIPLFLKSIVYLLQIGRNLGILFPLIPPVMNGTVAG